MGERKKMDVGGKKYRSDAEVGIKNMISSGKKMTLGRNSAGKSKIDGQGDRERFKSPR